MPYFSWYGIDQTGTISCGVMQARNATDLEQALEHNRVNLLQATAQLHRSRLRPVRTHLLSFFYRQLGVMLDAGIYLDRALEILHQQARHTIFKDIIADMRATVSHGISLHVSCGYHPHIFGNIDQGLLQAGQETGQLSRACLLLADYHEQKASVLKKLRAALVVPIITLIVFIVVALLIILLLAPTFGQLFESMNQPIPEFTQRLLTLSQLLQSSSFVYVGLALVCFALLLYRWAKQYIQKHVDYIVLFVPVVGPLIYERDLLFFLQSFSLLIEGKIPIVNALQLAKQTMHNRHLYNQIALVAESVERGQSLANALERMASLFTADCLALITIGQESSNLALMLKQATTLYQDRVNRRLMILNTLVQPTLMIVLGVLILFLIVSIYLPIFNLSLHIA